MPPLTVICLSFPPDLSPSLLAVNTTRRGGPATATRSTQRFKVLAHRIAEAHGSTGMFGQSTRKCAFPSLVRRGTSPDSTASRLTLPNARNGTARTPPQFYLREPSHFSRRRTASTTRRSQRSRFAGSRWIQSTSAPLPCVAATPKRFMLPPYRRFHPLLPRQASLVFLTGC